MYLFSLNLVLFQMFIISWESEGIYQLFCEKIDGYLGQSTKRYRNSDVAKKREQGKLQC